MDNNWVMRVVRCCWRWWWHHTRVVRQPRLLRFDMTLRCRGIELREWRDPDTWGILGVIVWLAECGWPLICLLTWRFLMDDNGTAENARQTEQIQSKRFVSNVDVLIVFGFNVADNARPEVRSSWLATIADIAERVNVHWVLARWQSRDVHRNENRRVYVPLLECDLTSHRLLRIVAGQRRWSLPRWFWSWRKHFEYSIENISRVVLIPIEILVEYVDFSVDTRICKRCCCQREHYENCSEPHLCKQWRRGAQAKPLLYVLQSRRLFIKLV